MILTRQHLPATLPDAAIGPARQFNASAEAVAALAWQRPVIPARDIHLERALRNVSHNYRVHAAAIQLDGVEVRGFTKRLGRKSAAQQILLANLASALGAPSAPYIKINQANGFVLFTPVTFDVFERGITDPQPNVPVTARPLTGHVASLAAAGQFRGLIHDIDNYPQNNVRCKTTGAICLYDHEWAFPHWSLPRRLSETSRDFIAHTWDCLIDDVARADYLTHANDMATRIRRDGPSAIKRIATTFDTHDLKVGRLFAAALQMRSLALTRPYGLAEKAQRAGLSLAYQPR